MSTVTGISSSGAASYAAQLAQTAGLKRSLYNLDTAVKSGNLTAAGSVLTALMKANPQFATSSTTDSTAAPDPINQGFQDLAGAISKNQTDAAQSAWTQLKSDLGKKGITQLVDGSALAAQTVAAHKVSMNQTLLSSLFGASSQTTPSVSTLLSGIGGASSSSNPLSDLVSNWLTYKASGSTSAAAAAATSGKSLNTAV